MKEINEHLHDAAWCLENANHGDDRVLKSLAHSALAIAQMMHMYMFATVTHINGVTTWTPPEPCQCKAEPDDLAAAAPELLQLVRNAVQRLQDGNGFECPWCFTDTEIHADYCRADAILKRFEDRAKSPTKPRKQFEQNCPGPLYLAVDADGKKHLVRDRVPVELFEPCKQNTPPGVVPPAIVFESTRDGVADLAIEALYTDGAHHKQWYLECILRYLHVGLDEIRAQTGDWQEGIVP